MFASFNEKIKRLLLNRVELLELCASINQDLQCYFRNVEIAAKKEKFVVLLFILQ